MNQLSHWFTAGHSVKVRRTFDKKTGEMKAQIIKTRVADLEVFNPNEEFDYRISISLETPWNGPESHLRPTADKKDVIDRLKDRLSYKHRDYQIDLTQISDNDPDRPGQHKHEVEVEINNDSFSVALGNARAGSGDQYEKCINGFIDNIRILASQATRAMQDARALAQQRPPGAGRFPMSKRPRVLIQRGVQAVTVSSLLTILIRIAVHSFWAWTLCRGDRIVLRGCITM